MCHDLQRALDPSGQIFRTATAERLAATATVLGLFEKWESSLRDVSIATGDVLVIYTDGITEANNSAGEEFASRGFSTRFGAISFFGFLASSMRSFKLLSSSAEAREE